MKRIIAIILSLIFIFSFASCNSSKKNEELEQKYYDVAHQYIENGNNEKAKQALEEGLSKLPDSILLQGLLDSITETTTIAPTTAAPVEIDDETIIAEFKAMRKEYRKWFEEYTFKCDKTKIKYLEDYSSQYPVSEPEIKTLNDLDSLFLGYCTKDVLDGYKKTSFVKYKDIDGKLHAVQPEIMELKDTEDKEFIVSKVSDTEYKFVYNEYHNDYGDIYYYKVTLDYILVDGDWKFSEEKREDMGYVDDAGSSSDDSYDSDYDYGYEVDAHEIIDDVGGLVNDTLNGVGGLVNKYF